MKFLNKNDWWLAREKMGTVGGFFFFSSLTVKANKQFETGL